MSEILHGLQIPQHILRPEYWNNHGFADECEWADDPIKDRETSDRTLTQYNRHLVVVYKASWEYAKDFWQKGTNINLSEFREGTTFDGKMHTVGTVIRHSSEHMFFDYEGQPHYYDIVLLGIVCDVRIESGLQRELAYYHEISSRKLHLLSYGNPAIEIGKVSHLKTTGGYIFRASNDMDRVTKVEILQAGLGQAEQSEKRKSFLPRFTFAPQNRLCL